MRAPQHTRAFTILIAAVLLHAAILIRTLPSAFNGLPEAKELGDTAVVVLVCLASFWTMLTLWPAYTRTVAALTGLLVASALLTPGVVAVVGLVLLNAHLTGARLISWADRGNSTYAALPASITTLIGFCVWLGLMSITASLKIHYPPVYVAVLLVPLGVWWRQTLSLLNTVRQQLAQPAAVTRGTERVWVSLLLTVLVLHLIVVAKPEVGYDANAMHLQFARLFAEHHRWQFDVTRYAWAVMPLGADYAFGAAFILGGEYAARLLNFGFGALSCLIAYQLLHRYAQREIALASVCLFASTPLAFLETGTLYVEGLWAAFLLGTLLLALDYAEVRSASALVALAVLGAGAMQTKVIGVIWIAPLIAYVGYLLWRRRAQAERTPSRRTLPLVLAATLVAVWPYSNAWIRTGNPVFPFMNNVFQSPYFDSAQAFVNEHYAIPLRPWSIYEIFYSSGRFIEGWDGAAGFQWLLLLPVIFLGFVRRRPSAQWLCLALAALFFVAVFSQQAYLRYLVPSLLLIMVLGGWTLSDLPWPPVGRVALLVIGGMICLLNLQFMPAANWTNAMLCPSCALDGHARARYVAAYLPDRAVAEYLTAALPAARIGFFSLNAPGASGYTGYSRAANWHDVDVYKVLLAASSAEDVLAIARRYNLTHAVFVDPSIDLENPFNSMIDAFRDRYTTPVWRYGGLVVAIIMPET
jgi:Dolichyl-phosphate-mannose-protein mannosyltransferase